MKIGRIDFRFIRSKIRKRYWSECYLLVIDVGHRYVWGDIYDATTGQHFGLELFSVADDDWELYVDAKKFIELLPTKTETLTDATKTKQ
jgi:hypothetical protein